MKKLKIFLTNLLPLISLIIPKRKNLWVFGAWQGKLYSDNTKALFEYINQNCTDIDAIWITRENSVVENVNGRGFKCYNRYSLRGIWATLRARIAFVTEGDYDISWFLNNKATKVIQLWHGVAPKKTNWDTFNANPTMVRMRRNSYWMTSSEQNSKTMHEIIGSLPERSFATGYPRNDIFVNISEISDVRKELDELYPDCKKIIYMPTHRNFGTSGAEFSEKDMLELDAKLRNNNIIMVFKPHFHELKNYLHLESSFTNIVLAKDSKYSDVYSYIKDFDLLISDYSSIIYDFTCAKKPIVLFPYDLEKFKNTDAGLFDYFETIPAGPFCYTWDEVVTNVVNLLNNDIWKEKREICRLTFHPFDDGKNCERVFDTVVNKVLKK